MVDFAKINRVSKMFKGPKSLCTCGHTGDGSDSQHEDADYNEGGHGKCKVSVCDCRRFTWFKFRDEYMRAIRHG